MSTQMFNKPFKKWKDTQVARGGVSAGDATLVIEFGTFTSPIHPSSLVGSRRGLPTNSRFGMGVDGGEMETINVKQKHENDIVRAVISSTKAKPVPMSEEDAEIVAQYEIHKAWMEEQQKINKGKRVERRAEWTSVGGIGG
ncbi:hypothetical protein B9Z19DRAFT_1133754 [Tuber borchii]|uniref:Uncharacterized protein n=1 Tax=Tuber borchii TaxID=42251 RepID=A0A2T6ZFD7_TUBBO|nr:hypothetical protein B9Z19DRAFT_1133754 [Tuber borchii]